jgi:hypothetical protein
VSIGPVGKGFSGACAPSQPQATKIEGVTTAAAVCSGPTPLPAGNCPNKQDLCSYSKASGFSLCIIGDVDYPCPEGFPNKLLYYDDRDECFCTCDDPVGEVCSTKVTVYADSACTQPLASANASSDKPETCANVAPGSTPRGVSATPPVYQSGTCMPKLTKSLRSTLCCMN